MASILTGNAGRKLSETVETPKARSLALSIPHTAHCSDLPPYVQAELVAGQGSCRKSA